MMNRNIAILIHVTAILCLFMMTIQFFDSVLLINDFFLYSPLILYPVIHILICTIVLIVLVKSIRKRKRIKELIKGTTSSGNVMNVFVAVLLLCVVAVCLFQIAAMLHTGSGGTKQLHEFSAFVTIILLSCLFAWKSYHDKKTITRLQHEIHNMKAREILIDEKLSEEDNFSRREALLKQYYRLFSTSETYRDLHLLYELKPGQVINNEARTEFVGQVLAAFYDVIRPLMDGNILTKEDIFICLMFYMGFTTRCISACLGVTEDAIRKRKSRLHQKLSNNDYILFFDHNK